jgi:hypothetical protein
MPTRHINSIPIILKTNNTQKIIMFANMIIIWGLENIFQLTNKSATTSDLKYTAIMQRKRDTDSLLLRESSPSTISTAHIFNHPFITNAVDSSMSVAQVLIVLIWYQVIHFFTSYCKWLHLYPIYLYYISLVRTLHYF